MEKIIYFKNKYFKQSETNTEEKIKEVKFLQEKMFKLYSKDPEV